MKHEELIGQKMIGFKFPDSSPVGYARQMNDCIGKLGEIVRYDARKFRSYYVRFTGASYWYPADEVEEQFIEEEIDINELFEKIKKL